MRQCWLSLVRTFLVSEESAIYRPENEFQATTKIAIVAAGLVSAKNEAPST